MAYRCPNLPFLPGFSFDPNIGRTRFHLNQQFDFISNVPCMVEKVKPKMFGPLSDRYPSLYARGEVTELPPWIAFDKQILCFDAFFKETLQEIRGSPFQVRKVKINFFLEDGTIQVTEPKVENSGIAQGTLVCRQRIRFPAPMDENFYDVIDFNVGREVEFYGRIYKIVNCDKFSRNFLNRLGIAVPDPINAPVDPYMDIRSHNKDGLQAKKPNRSVDTLGKFLENDRKVLRFNAYWDDQETQFGYLHILEVHFYLADDTIEIIEMLPTNSGRDCGPVFLRRGKLPKVFKELPQPGADSPFTVLNVLGTGLARGRYVVDPLDCGRQTIEYYSANDFAIGSAINCYGRKIVLTDCDQFTKSYYSVKYGRADFDPLPLPKDIHETENILPKERVLPPWNGYGSHEDSAQNCITVEPKAPHRDFQKFLKFDKLGLDSYVLRFEARMLSKIKENCSRIFIISYFLSDDSISVFEVARENSGFSKKTFFRRSPIKLPGQKTYTSKPPLCYTPQHMYIGATIIINSFEFVLIDADEYALRFMELNCNEYPKSDINAIMDKVRNKLRPIYRDFVAENMPEEVPALSYEVLRDKLCKIMGDEFTEHEMITIARSFSANCYQERFDRERIRAITLTELKRFLWDDLERLKEYLLVRDPFRTGKLPKSECYTILRACRLPLDLEIINKILEVIKKDEDCNLYYEDLLKFLNREICPMRDVEPINVKYHLWWGSEKKPRPGILIDWCGFNKSLDLESVFKENPFDAKFVAAIVDGNNPENNDGEHQQRSVPHSEANKQNEPHSNEKPQ